MHEPNPGHNTGYAARVDPLGFGCTNEHFEELSESDEAILVTDEREILDGQKDGFVYKHACNDIVSYFDWKRRHYVLCI